MRGCAAVAGAWELVTSILSFIPTLSLQTMRSARIIALLAAAVAPLVQGAPADGLVLLADGPKTTASWSYKDCGASSSPLDESAHNS